MSVKGWSNRYAGCDTPFYEDSGLSLMEEEFVAQYLVLRKGGLAAIRAGYSPRSAGMIASELLKRPRVMKAIQERRHRHLQKLDATAERIALEAARIAFADPRNLMEWDEETGAFVPSVMLNDDEAAAIAEVESVTHHTDAGPVTRTRVKTHNKIQALRLLAQMQGRLPEANPVVNVHIHEVRERISGRITSIAARIGKSGDSGRANGNGAGGA